jgi:3-oxoadipate enol-lactonase
MSRFRVDADCEMAYAVDDFTDPWVPSESVVMLHGLAESGEAWRGWVPHFARDFRVVRPDLRGFGQSTPMPPDYPWRHDQILDDVLSLLDHLGIERAHVIGAKIGGTLAMRLAARYPQRMLSLTAVGAPFSLKSFSGQTPVWRSQIREQGVKSWVASTMEGRLGTTLPRKAVDWWIKLMAASAPSTLEGFLQMVPTVDVTGDLASIACRGLIVTTTRSPLGSVADVRRWQQTIPRSELAVIEGDSYHIAASAPDQCAELVKAFVIKNDPQD